MNIYWKIFTKAGTEAAAEKVLNRILQELGADGLETRVEKYHKGGYTCTFVTPAQKNYWPFVVYESHMLADLVGRGWTRRGNITNEVDLWCDDSKISGVSNIHITADRDDFS